MKRRKKDAGGGDIFLAENGRLTRGFDSAIYNSAKIQRPCGFLTLYRAGDTRNLDRYEFLPGNGYGDDHKPQVLETLLHFCPVEAPTWAELSHFASFLNVQLETTERSVFCNSAVVGEDSGLRGFKGVMVDFNLNMSQDFSSRSIEISDQSHGDNLARPAISERRRWETKPHPYIFFNSDETYSFYGLYLQRGQEDNRYMDLVDERSKAILKRGIMSEAAL